MSTPSSFYAEQALICAKSAAETLLPQLREKYLRSQAAWEALAERETSIKAARAIRDAETESRINAGIAANADLAANAELAATALAG